MLVEKRIKSLKNEGFIHFQFCEFHNDPEDQNIVFEFLDSAGTG